MGGVVWSSEASTEPEAIVQNVSSQVEDDEEERKKSRREEMEKFKEELKKKREARHGAIVALNAKITQLQNELEKEKSENEKLRKRTNLTDYEELKEKLKQVEAERDEAKKEIVLLKSGIDEEIENERKEELEGLEMQIKALKEVATIGSDMLKIRELQVNELKEKLAAIEETGQQYEKEVENMRRLRNLYEERSRAITISHQMELERERAKVIASETKKELAEQQLLIVEERNKELGERVATLDGALDAAKAEISDLRIQLAGKSEDLYNLSRQMSIVNQLFCEVLSPGNNNLEKVSRVLEEHHDLINHLTAAGKMNDLASTLLNIANKENLPNTEEEDMASHLSKVWRILVELLGHHMKQVPEDAPPESCYKSIETPSGPKLVISVSQTFLRLKDLILEKNSLVKEVGRLKDLNSTLEHRLIEQETRLSVVAAELHTTWGVVSKLKNQHKQLHTHEKVLRYELAQKRLMLNELKRELEECKENWTLARVKNNKTEQDWKKLRTEFALRKQQASSAESGYEESPTDSQDEDDSWKLRQGIIDKKDEEDKEESIPDDKASSEEEDFTVGDHCKVLPWDSSSPKEEPPSELSTSPPDSSPLHTSVPEPVKQESPVSAETSLAAATTTSELKRERTAEEILDARQVRLKRLEEQCKGLFNKMSQTSQRSDQISNRLVELHEHYSEDKRPRTGKDSASTSLEENVGTIENESNPTVSQPKEESHSKPHQTPSTQITEPDTGDPKT